MRWENLEKILNLENFSDPKTKLIIFIICLVIIVLLIIFIATLYKLRKIRRGKKEYSEKEVDFEKTTRNPKKELVLLDKTARGFFSEYLKTESKMTYGEIEKKLREKRKHYWAGFCQKMSYCLYSGKEVKKEEILDLKTQFKNITEGKKPRFKKPKKSSRKKPKKSKF